MLATILKSPKATQTTIAIIETFAKIKELTRTVSKISESHDEQEQKGLIQHGGDILSDLLYQEIPISSTETSVELNFAVLKLRHTIKRKSNQSSLRRAMTGLVLMATMLWYRTVRKATAQERTPEARISSHWSHAPVL